MSKKHCAIIVAALLLGACQPKIFGLDETVWNTLSEQEREKVIDGYNKCKEIELLNAQKRKDKELENERHRQEVEAQTAPIYAAADVVSSIWGNARPECGFSVRIQSVSSSKGKQVLTIANEQFDVSPFSRMSQAWIKGQKVELMKNEDDFFYPVKIRNIDNKEIVNARKSKSS